MAGASHLLALDALALTRWQSCKRQGTLSQNWRMFRHRPKSLFDALLRNKLKRLAQPSPPDGRTLAREFRIEFMSAAADPGLDVPGDRCYKEAKEWCAIGAIILRVLAQTPYPLRFLRDIDCGQGISWNPLSLGIDSTGMLHRWITVERWDAPALLREMHSWVTMGDIAMLSAPMQLHVIVLGQMKDGYHRSAWGRRWRSVHLPHRKPHFLSPTGKPLRPPHWQAEFLSDFAVPERESDEWAQQAQAEGAIAPLLQNAVVERPGEAACRDIRRQIVAIAQEIEAAKSTPWYEYPMSRGACDGLRPCIFQPCCHSESPREPESVGLYAPLVTIGIET